jgi:hypothetical protein
MDDRRVNQSQYVWVAMVAVFLLVFGGIWIASSPREAPRDPQPAANTSAPNYDAFDRSYTARVPAEPPLPSAPVFGNSSTPTPAPQIDSPSVVVTPLPPQTPQRKLTNRPKDKPKDVSPRDMFPVGDITRDLPKVAHRYAQVAELYPSFEYQGKVWSSTGRYVLSSQADLVSTGIRLSTGQNVYTLPDGGVSDGVMFVQSGLDPVKYAVYRAS